MRIGGVDTKDNTADLLTKYLQPPLHSTHTRQLHINQPHSITNTHTCISLNATRAQLTNTEKQRHQTSQPTHHRQVYPQLSNPNVSSPTVLFCSYLRIRNMDCSVVGIVGVLDKCVAPCVTMVVTSGLFSCLVLFCFVLSYLV